MSNTAEIINFPNKTEQPGGRMADLSNGYTKVANEIQQLKPSPETVRPGMAMF